MGDNLYKYQAGEVLNKVMNTGEDALKVDIDNATITAGSIEVNLDASNDSVEVIQDTPADLKATVTQASIDRTISGTVSVTPASVSSTTKTSNATIKSGAGNMYSVFVSFVGVTVGDKIELKDNATVLMTFTATLVNESFQFNSHAKIPFGTSLVYAETKNSGAITTTVVFD
jgi:hypothetical protein